MWEVISFAFGNLDDEFRKAGYIGQVENVIQAQTFGNLRNAFIKNGDQQSASRFRSGLRLTLLMEGYCLDRIGRAFYSIGDNALSGLIYDGLSALTGLKSRDDFHNVGQEAFNESKKPLEAFLAIQNQDCNSIANIGGQ